MRRQHILVLLAILIAHITSAQQLKPVAKNVQQAKIEGKAFKTIDKVIKVKKESLSLDKIIDPTQVVLLDYNRRYFEKEIANTETSNLSLTLPLEPNYLVTVDLVEVPPSFYRYKVKTASGNSLRSNPNAKHYRGIVRGMEAESMVAISFFKDEMAGVISLDEKGNYNVGKLKNTDTHMIFNDRNFEEEAFICEANDVSPKSPSTKTKQIGNQSGSRASQICIKNYFEVDYGIYKHFDNNEVAVENYVIALFNEVATIYQNEGMFVEISEIFIWDTEDPFSNDGPGGALYPFRNYRTTFNGDLAHLLSYRDNTGTLPARGIAMINGLCSTNRRYYAVTELFPSFENYPTFSHQVQVVAHEMAHNIGSKHTHDCEWNDNDTQIDDYGSVSQNDIDSDPQPCYSEPGLFDVTPTIMSYYGSRGWGTYPLTNGFGEQPGNLLRENVANATCLTECVNCFADLVEIYANDKDITYTPTVNLPCGETCFDLTVNNLENIEYRVTGNVIIDSDGSVCVPQDTFESSGGLIEIMGTDSCGNEYTKVITIVVEDCCPVLPPTNLHVIENTLHWDAVPNAIGYIVRSPSYFDVDCECKPEISVVPIETTSNSLELSPSLSSKCFVWYVTALCHDGYTSPISEQACYSPTIGLTSNISEEKISILPNPNNGDMNIDVNLDYQTEVTLNIYRVNGARVKALETPVIKNNSHRRWNSKGSLPKGLYFFIFNTHQETITKKVIIQ